MRLVGSSLTTRRWLQSGIVLVSVFMACARDSQAPSPSADPDQSRWLVLETNDSLRAEVDTTGVKWHAGRGQVWIGFSAVQDERLSEVAPAFLRFETLQDVNCMMGIARGIESRIPDSTGAVRVVPVRDSAWFLIRDHPLGPYFESVCRAFKQP